MPERRSRHERLQLQTETSTSIFDLAKSAQARVMGVDDLYSSMKKSTKQFIDLLPIDLYEPSSPSDLSEGDEWLSDVSEELREEEEYRERQAHRAAALAALEGRAPPLQVLEPIFRSARMSYDDHVEAEHGQLHTFQPKPRRPAARFQNSIISWDEQIIANEIEVVDTEEPCDYSPTMSEQNIQDALDWLNSDSPVDLLNGRPVFYSQVQSQNEEFWGEMTLEQLNAIA